MGILRRAKMELRATQQVQLHHAVTRILARSGSPKEVPPPCWKHSATGWSGISANCGASTTKLKSRVPFTSGRRDQLEPQGVAYLVARLLILAGRVCPAAAGQPAHRSGSLTLLAKTILIKERERENKSSLELSPSRSPPPTTKSWVYWFSSTIACPSRMKAYWRCFPAWAAKLLSL